MRLLLLTALAAALSLPAAAQVGILGGVQGDAQAPNREFSGADRARLLFFPSQVYYYTLPLNGARNYNFYYVDGVANNPQSNQTFLSSGPWRVEYIDANGGHAAGSLQGIDDAGYATVPNPSGNPYSANPPFYLNNADVFFGARNTPVSQLPINLANPVLIDPNGPASGQNVYRGALGIQGVVRLSNNQEAIGATVQLWWRKGGQQQLVSTLVTNGTGFYSFYYTPGTNKEFILPPADIANGGRYVVVASMSGATTSESQPFIYAPNTNKGAATNQPVANRDYYVVGARGFDSGAGLPVIQLGSFTSGCYYARTSDSPASAAARSGSGSGGTQQRPPCYLERGGVQVPSDPEVAAAYDDATDRYLAASERLAFVLAEQADAGQYAALPPSAELVEAAANQTALLKGGALATGSAASAEASRAALALSVGPNPLRGTGSVRFALAESGNVSLAVYDALGRQVASLQEGLLEAGLHAYPVATTDLAPGVYVVRLSTSSLAETARFTVVR